VDNTELKLMSDWVTFLLVLLAMNNKEKGVGIPTKGYPALSYFDGYISVDLTLPYSEHEEAPRLQELKTQHDRLLARKA
jgi:hypothetical protein